RIIASQDGRRQAIAALVAHTWQAVATLRLAVLRIGYQPAALHKRSRQSGCIKSGAHFAQCFRQDVILNAAAIVSGSAKSDAVDGRPLAQVAGHAPRGKSALAVLFKEAPDLSDAFVDFGGAMPATRIEPCLETCADRGDGFALRPWQDAERNCQFP